MQEDTEPERNAEHQKPEMPAESPEPGRKKSAYEIHHEEWAEGRPEWSSPKQPVIPQQTQGGNLPPGWHTALPETIPHPTYWPAGLGFGIVLFFWGLEVSFLILAAGAIIFLISLAGWIGDFRHE